jgi:ATP-dependent Clp protease ATP-binding subunit ClpA
MFDRYTEKARRAIFFARYEASNFGSPQIDTEHLLLGILREHKELTNRFLRSFAALESVRKQIETHAGIPERIATSVDLPLTSACKRVLAFAAEEAEGLRHRNIGGEHLFLGILREKGCFAQQILLGFGVSAEEVRRYLAGTGVPAEPPANKPPESPESTIERLRQRADEMQSPYNLQVVAEDGSTLATIRWNRRRGRLPQIGEALLMNSAGRRVKYRIVDVLWEIADGGEAAEASPITLRAREENAPETGS